MNFSLPFVAPGPSKQARPKFFPGLVLCTLTVWHCICNFQVQMTTTDWDECGYWLSAVKRLIKMRMQGM